MELGEEKSSKRGWWVPTSYSDLVKAESKLLSYLKTPYTAKFVNIGKLADSDQNCIWTLVFNEKSTKTPLVLVHGFASGIGVWLLNLDFLARDRPVYAFDLLGFGRSSRPTFSTDLHELETQLLDSIEAWRQQMNLGKFDLLGHSMGGYLVALYALRFPERLRHLILCDPWGFTGNPSSLPLWVKGLAFLVSPFNPFVILRAAGPFGYGFVEWSRPDIKPKYAKLLKEDQQAVIDYLYHCSALYPSGEAAFKTLTEHFAWISKPVAKLPVAERFERLNTSISVSFIYGSDSWIIRTPGYHFQETKPDRFKVHIIENADHDMPSAQPEAFNNLVKHICDDDASYHQLQAKLQEMSTNEAS